MTFTQLSVRPQDCAEAVESGYLGCLQQSQQASLIALHLAVTKTRPCTTEIDGLNQFSKYGLPFSNADQLHEDGLE